jgi:hypothetical protein
VEEAQGVPGGERARLLRVDHVVGDGGDLGDTVAGRTQGAERVDGGHGTALLRKSLMSAKLLKPKTIRNARFGQVAAGVPGVYSFL